MDIEMEIIMAQQDRIEPIRFTRYLPTYLPIVPSEKTDFTCANKGCLGNFVMEVKLDGWGWI